MVVDFLTVGAAVAPDSGDQAGGAQNQHLWWQLNNSVIYINDWIMFDIVLLQAFFKVIR